MATPRAASTPRRGARRRADETPAARADPRADGAAKAAGRSRGRAGGVAVGSIVVTHPERVVYAQPPLTKLDVVRYYAAITPWLFDEIVGRPVSLVRCPQGTAAPSPDGAPQCFFQKHLERLPPGVANVPSDDPDIAAYVHVTEPAGIVALAQHGTLEFHVWGARLPKLQQPDRIVLDLDPDPELPWPRVIEAAQITRALLAELALPAFLRTTGGKGLHVVVPLRPRQPWDTVKDVARALADTLAGADPDRFTATLAKARRTGKVFVDYLRNGQGATAIASWSLRARAGAPVATPIAWDDLTARRDLRGDHFNLRNAVAHAPDAAACWRDFDAQRATLGAPLLKRLGVVPTAARSAASPTPAARRRVARPAR